MAEICKWFVPWNQYDSSLVKISECHHWIGEVCERNDCGKCKKPWIKNVRS